MCEGDVRPFEDIRGLPSFITYYSRSYLFFGKENRISEEVFSVTIRKCGMIESDIFY